MKKAFICSCILVCVVLIAVSASAQSSQNSDFKGFYVGGHFGVVNGQADASTSTVFSPTGYFAASSVPAIATAGQQSLSSKGFNAGATAGYNFQPNRWVFGGEVDFGALHLSDNKTSGAIPYPCCPGSTFTVGQSIRSNWLFTARPRVGYTWGKWLVFGTGGLAIAHVDYRARFTDTFASAKENGGVNEGLIGWTVGGGAEYSLQRHWSVKGEYLYANFGDNSATSTNLTAFSPAIAFPDNVFTHTTSLTTHIIRGGLNYRF